MPHNSRKLALLLSIIVLMGAATVATGGVASAAHVTCGSVIIQSTTLDSDVGPCAAGGITVAADNVTLDLNGFRVFGVPALPGDGVGVAVAGRTGVLVTNGTITDFDAGVAIIGGSANTVSGITARDNISTLAAGDFGDGIAISDSSHNLIIGNIADHNGPFDGIGVFGATSTGNLIEDNLVVDNNIASSPTTNQDDGIRLEPGTNGNTVRNNVVRGSGLDGIAVFANSVNNVVEGNDVDGNGFHDKTHRKGDGVRTFLGANDTLVQTNSVFDNAASGIRVDSQSNDILNNQTGGNDAAADVTVNGGDLVVVEGSVRAVLVVNGETTEVDPGPAPAYDLFDTNPGNTCDANVWSGNTFGTAFPDCTKS